MDGCFQALEKTVEFRNRIPYRKPAEKNRTPAFDVRSQPAGNLATQRLLRSTTRNLGTRQLHDSTSDEACCDYYRGTRMTAPTLQGSCAACASGTTSCPKCEEEETALPSVRNQPGPTSQDILDVDDQEHIGQLIGTFQDPDCNAFRASSNCNVSNGVYEIVSIEDPCCSQGCTRKHEQRHVMDLSLCCMMLNDNIINKVAPRDELVDRYREWIKIGGPARSWTECNAYRVSVQCAQEEIKAKNCAKSDTQCCKELNFYLSLMKKEKAAYCDQAPATLPPCPFRPSPGPTP